MKRKAILCTLVSLSMSSGVIFAQGRGHPGERNDHEQAQGRHQNQAPAHGPTRLVPRHGHDDRWAPQRPPGPSQREMGRGAGPQHAFHRGGRLPGYYHQQRYVVDDWRGHKLSAPPRGYHWVQTGDDFVLVAIATGVILQLLLNH